MNDCVNCDERCFGNTTQSNCVVWNGPDIECVGIKKGQYLNDSVASLAEKLCEKLDRRVDLKCLYTNNCDNCSKTVEVEPAVQVLIDKICNLTSEDIEYTGNLYCLGESSISPYAAELSGKNFTYGNAITGNSSNVFFDFADAVSDLPSGFSLGSTQAILSGAKKNGKTIINESNAQCVSFPVELDRYPLNLDISANVNTPNGTVKLSRLVNIPTAGAFNGSDTFSVQDFGAPNERVMSQSDLNQRLAAQVCNNKQKIEAFERFEVKDCDDVKYPTSKLKDIVGINAGAICDLSKRLKAIETVSVTTCQDGNCGGETVEKKLLEALNEMNQQICDLKNEVAALKSQNLAQEQAIADTATNCSSCASGNCSGGNCGGANSSGGTGGCSGGNCGGNAISGDGATTGGGTIGGCTTGNCGGTFINGGR